ncbi:MAG TPA: hypothetical protein VLB44_02015 [Kofleriaceae bacterium]|nr:hypothetical protein [Kofleriaceae bacterium]
MQRDHLVAALVALAACKGRHEPPLRTGAAGSAVTAVAASDAAVARVVGPDAASAAIPPRGDGGVDDTYRALDIAFDFKRPALAWLGPDEQVAVFDFDDRSMFQPTSSAFVVYKVGKDKALDRLAVADDAMASPWKEPLSPDTIARLHEHAEAITARLSGWTPLTQRLPWTITTTQATTVTIGGHTLTATQRERSMRLALGMQRSEVFAFDTKQTHQEDEATLPCSYTPREVSVYADGDQILVGVRYQYSIDCDPHDPTWFVWSPR